jgi:hypothetical protein
MPGRCSSIVKRVVRSTSVPIADLSSPMMKSPSQWPGTRSRTDPQLVTASLQLAVRGVRQPASQATDRLLFGRCADDVQLGAAREDRVHAHQRKTFWSSSWSGASSVVCPGIVVMGLGPAACNRVGETAGGAADDERRGNRCSAAGSRPVHPVSCRLRMSKVVSSHASSTRRPLASSSSSKGPIPERGALGRLCGCVGGDLLGLVPAAQRERPNVRDLPLQVQHQTGNVGLAALACLLEPDVKQIMAGQRHHGGNMTGERGVRLRPQAQMSAKKVRTSTSHA